MEGRPDRVQFARLLGISRNTVARYESDAQGADKPIVLMRWAEVTGYDCEWLSSGQMPDTVTNSECYPGPSARRAGRLALLAA